MRVSSTVLKRLDRLDAPLRAERQRAAYVIALHTGYIAEVERVNFTLAQRTVLSWPRILPADEFDRIASAAQDKLVAASWEDRSLPERPVVTGPDPADVTHRYKSNAKPVGHIALFGITR